MEDESDLACHWGDCAAGVFESAQLLDQHVETTHVKTKRAVGMGKGSDKGVVCEWKDCTSEKIYRDSWNLVTHMRYKHTHFKPFVCTHKNCDKAFVQLHQMKKHAKTPHESSGGRGRGRKRQDQRASGASRAKLAAAADDSDSDFGHELQLADDDDNDVDDAAGEEDELAALASMGSATKRRRQKREAAESRDGEETAERNKERLRVASPLEMDAVEGLLQSTIRPLTPEELMDGRLASVVSPTSLLATNTALSSMDPRDRAAMLWSPQQFLAPPVDRLGSTPTPPVLDEHLSSTPDRAFSARPPPTAFTSFVPISNGVAAPVARPAAVAVGTGAGAGAPSGPAEPQFKPSRPIPSPLPAPELYK